MKEVIKKIIEVVFILFLIGLIFSFFSVKKFEIKPEIKEVGINVIAQKINEGEVKKIVVSGNEVKAILKDKKILISSKEPETGLTETLKNLGVSPEKLREIEIEIKGNSQLALWLGFIIPSILPILLLIFLFWWSFKQAQKGAGQAFTFVKSRLKKFRPEKDRITFDDVADLKEAKEELQEIVDFLKNPQKFLDIGAKIPRGVLLVGPPGCGKTLLARAVAGTAGVPFFHISGSEFIELFVGVGAARVRDCFQTAKEAAKKEGAAILFIDEIDAIGRERGAGLGGGHDEREQTLNQILVEMDGFEKEDRLIVMAASITGETPVMVKRRGKIEILPIKEVIDPYYQENEERIEKFVKDDLEVLGFERKIPKNCSFYPRILFKKAAFKKVRSVYRHKVNEIYEVRYLGGKIRTTGNHSLFVRTKQGIQPKLVSELKPGDILVDLPFKVNRSSKKFREIRAFEDFKEPNLELKVWQPLFDKNFEIQKAYEFALQSSLSQEKIGKKFGFSQTTISKWQRGVHLPRALSKEYFKAKEILPEKVKVTKDLMRLFGYYVAEGYARKEVDFCVGKNEKEIIEDIKGLMKKIFNLEPDREREITEGAINLVYYTKPVAEFFKYWCGSGAQNKHLPWFLFELPQEYFLEFLKGWARGDGHFNKRGALEITSVSKRLIIEANWLARMHGFKPFVTKFVAKEGRKIKDGKPLKATVAYRLSFAKSQNPFGGFSQNSPTRLPKVISVKKIPYNGYVYDFCGCENEAFFAGESPVLAHNTNRPDILDPALLRPGRFDRRIVLDLPDLKGREEILKIHTRHIPLAKDVDLKVIAERTPGFSGADLENLVNEAAILAARKDKKVVSQEEFLAAIEKVLLGPERKSFLLSEKERKIAAYHEAGHAIVSAFTPSSSKVQKISIVARGKAAGYTLRLPEEEKHFKTKTEFLADLASLLGGYAAEKLVFGEITTGAANDLRDATDIARALVTKYGMSSLGPIAFGKFSQPVFLGREIAVEKDYSDEVAAKIDRETKKFIDQAYKTAMKILKKHRKFLDKVAQILMKKETIEKEEFEKLVEEEKKKIKKE